MTSTDTPTAHTWTSSVSRWWNCTCGYSTPDQAEAQAHTAETTAALPPVRSVLDLTGRYEVSFGTVAASMPWGDLVTAALARVGTDANPEDVRWFGTPGNLVVVVGKA